MSEFKVDETVCMNGTQSELIEYLIGDELLTVVGFDEQYAVTTFLDGTMKISVSTSRLRSATAEEVILGKRLP